MARADWTYQVAPAGAPSAGLEEYVVLDASGSHVGKVATLLRYDGELWIALERGTPPVTHEVRAIPWSDVAQVDHDALTVLLSLEPGGVEEALELDPDRGTEIGDADAARVTELPPELRPAGKPGDVTRTSDRPRWALSVALGAAGLLALLAAVLVVTATESGAAALLFVVPGALLLAAGVAAYRTFRNPYERA